MIFDEIQKQVVYEYIGNDPLNSKFHTIKFPRGIFQLECWGASGYDYDEKNIGGLGGYTSGILKVSRPLTLYLYVGSVGQLQTTTVFNGGGLGQHTGGGATDFRLTPNSDWKNFNSLKSRIMVAAGGGGPDNSDNGGNAGGLTGSASAGGYGKGATQINGGDGLFKGSFGIGGGNPVYNWDGCGGGGGGYYGGGSSTITNIWGGGGGSSYISGFDGCNSVDPNSTETKIIHTGSSIHYSTLYFTNAVMIKGNMSMPSPSSSLDGIGHHGNGAARVTVLSLQIATGPSEIKIYYSVMFYLLYVYCF